ncbi:MAG: DNA polymerase V family protein [Anaerolineae bacterium]|nr:DNA polymerase V family protein [Anaerolineae bacterium]
MMNIRRLLFMGALLLGALSLAACDVLTVEGEPSEPVEEFGNSEEAEEGGGFDFSEEEAEDSAGEEDGFDFPEEEVDSEDNEGMDFPPEEVEAFDEELCAGLPDYVPCGTYAVDPSLGTMKCPNQTMTLDDSPEEFLTLIPQNDGNELFAVAQGSAEGTLSLDEIGSDGAVYSGPLVNAEGQTIHYTLYHFTDSDIISGNFTVSINNPGMGGTCVVDRTYSGIKLDE